MAFQVLDQIPRHLLTVVHSAERTGPPLLALQFLKWLHNERPSWRLSVLFIDEGGPLVPEFAELGDVLVNARDPHRAPARHPWLDAKLRLFQIRRRISQMPSIDLAHVHCIGAMRAKAVLPDVPVLCHVHEMSVGQDFHLSRASRDQALEASRYVAVSEAAREQLLANFSIDPQLVDRQWGFVDQSRLPRSVGVKPKSSPPNQTLVISSGVRNWRKAPELFVRTAIRCRALHPEINWNFKWIGGADSDGLASRVAAVGADNFIEFIDHRQDPLPLINDADIFLLLAREDAFPLVTVEAAALGKPIVTFDSGGAPELVANAGCGFVVPFPNVDEVCDRLASLAASDALRAELGESARKFASESLMLSAAGPKLLEVIEETMSGR